MLQLTCWFPISFLQRAAPKYFSVLLGATLIRPQSHHLQRYRNTFTKKVHADKHRTCTSVLLFWEYQYQVKNKLLPCFYFLNILVRGGGGNVKHCGLFLLLTDLKASATLNWKDFQDILKVCLNFGQDSSLWGWINEAHLRLFM